MENFCDAVYPFLLDWPIDPNTNTPRVGDHECEWEDAGSRLFSVRAVLARKQSITVSFFMTIPDIIEINICIL